MASVRYGHTIPLNEKDHYERLKMRPIETTFGYDTTRSVLIDALQKNRGFKIYDRDGGRLLKVSVENFRGAPNDVMQLVFKLR